MATREIDQPAGHKPAGFFLPCRDGHRWSFNECGPSGRAAGKKQACGAHGMSLAAATSMRPDLPRPRSRAAAIAFDLLDPIPYGCFVGALVFDAIYAKSAEVLWVKAAAWLIAIGLLVRGSAAPHRPGAGLVSRWAARDGRDGRLLAAICWRSWRRSRTRSCTAATRTASMPEGLWLSGLTVLLLVLAKVLPARQPVTARATP